MFTLTRLVAAILLMLFALWLVPQYRIAYDPEAPLNGLPRLLAVAGFIVGWMFLGQKSSRLWMSAYLGVQAVVLTGIAASGIVAVRDIFVLGYRRQVREPMEALLSIPQIMWDYLSRALTVELGTVLVVGGVVLGVAVHVIDRLFDRRRLAR